MRTLDKKYLLAILLTTLMMVVLYIGLNILGNNYANHMTGLLGGVEKAPLIVIATILSYWWLLYAAMIASLTFHWGIKRIFGH